MRAFFDTSVLVAAFWGGHPSHPASLKLVASANKQTSACALHTLAELYATMTALPVKAIIPAHQALLFVPEMRERFTIVSLDETEYAATIEEAAKLGLTRGHLRRSPPTLCRQN